MFIELILRDLLILSREKWEFDSGRLGYKSASSQEL
jgi:hypothetical protein